MHVISTKVAIEQSVSFDDDEAASDAQDENNGREPWNRQPQKNGKDSRCAYPTEIGRQGQGMSVLSQFISPFHFHLSSRNTRRHRRRSIMLQQQRESIIEEALSTHPDDGAFSCQLNESQSIFYQILGMSPPQFMS